MTKVIRSWSAYTIFLRYLAAAGRCRIGLAASTRVDARRSLPGGIAAVLAAGARHLTSTARFSGRTYPQLAQIVRELCAVAGRSVVLTRWPGLSRPRGRPRRSARELATPGGKDAFAQLRRCAGGRDRPGEAACPGRPMAGAGAPDRPRQMLAAAVTACLSASQTMRSASRPRLSSPQ